MRYAGIIALALSLTVVGMMPAAAQERSDTIIDRLLNQVAEDAERDGRRPTVVFGDRSAEQRAETRRRGRTGRSGEGGDYERDGDYDRDGDYERDERADRRNDDYEHRDDDYERAERRDEAHKRGNDRRRTHEQGRRGEYKRGAGQKAGNGPPFCRNGEGHPVHGRQWCVDKGWGFGNDRRVFDTRRDDRRYPSRTKERTILDDILGRRGGY